MTIDTTIPAVTIDTLAPQESPMNDIEFELRMYCDDEPHELTAEELDQMFADSMSELPAIPVFEDLTPFDDQGIPF